MAENTLSSRSKPRAYRRRSGDFVTWHFQESTCASTAQITVGDVVGFDVTVSSASGRIVRSSTLSGINVLSTSILGVALEDSTAFGNPGPSATVPSARKIPVLLADSQTEFLFATKATGAEHNSTILGRRAPLAFDSTLGIHYAQIGASSAADCSLVITEVIDPGTTNGYVVAKFLSTATARFVSGAF